MNSDRLGLQRLYARCYGGSGGRSRSDLRVRADVRCRRRAGTCPGEARHTRAPPSGARRRNVRWCVQRGYRDGIGCTCRSLRGAASRRRRRFVKTSSRWNLSVARRDMGARTHTLGWARGVLSRAAMARCVSMH